MLVSKKKPRPKHLGGRDAGALHVRLPGANGARSELESVGAPPSVDESVGQ